MKIYLKTQKPEQLLKPFAFQKAYPETFTLLNSW